MSTTNSSYSIKNVEREINEILKQNLNVQAFQKQLFQCVPEDILSEKVSFNLITYVLDNHKIKIVKCKTVLKYIIGLLEYNLINYDVIDTFYYNYYKLLVSTSKILVPLICQLIYMLTKNPNDLSRLLVLRVKKAFNENVPAKPLNCLLTLIKSLRPDLVPARIPAYSLEHAFQLLPIEFRNDLEKVKVLRTLNEQKSKSINIQWDLVNGNKKDLMNIIPGLSFVNIGSFYDKDTASKTIIEYDNLIELHSEICSSQNIANSMGLLNNFDGLHFLTYGNDESLKVRVIYSLKQSLRYEIIQFTPTSIQNRKKLFKVINNLYDCAQQGIPEISNLILDYFEDYKNFQIDQILLNLLSWTVITSFDDLHKRLLVPLRDVFITRYSLIDRCDIIDCLTNLIVNFATTCIYPSFTELKQPFPLPEDLQKEDYMSILKKLCQWISYFSLEAIKLDRDGLLSSILNLYHTLYHLQIRFDSTIISVAPPCVIYACLASMPFHYVDSCCKLLLRYVNIYEKKTDANDMLEITSTYITTFLGILKGESMEISPEVAENLCNDEWRLFIKRHKLSYGINKNLFLMPYVVHLIRKNEEITFNVMLNICKLYYPYVFEFWNILKI